MASSTLSTFEQTAQLLKRRKPEKRLLNAAEYGAVGDGTTDDTTALQAWLNAAPNDGQPYTYYLPAGTYKTTATLQIPGRPYTSIIGEGKYKSIICPGGTSGTPGNFACLQFGVDNTHSFFGRDFGIDYSYGYDTPNTNTAAIAVLYGVNGGSESGFYHHEWRSIEIRSAYRGFALKQGDKMQTAWNCSWTDIRMTGLTGSAFSFNPTTAIGMPNLLFRKIGIFNTNTSAKAVEPAFDLVAAEAQIDGLDLEGWQDLAINVGGGSAVLLNRFHLEWHHWTKGQSWPLYAANGPLVVNGFHMTGTLDSTNSDIALLAKAESNGQIVLSNGHYNVTNNSAGSYVRALTWGSDAGSVTSINVRNDGTELPMTGLGSRALETANCQPTPAPQQVTSITADTTLAANMGVLRCTGTAAITITLPTPNTVPAGQTFNLLNTSSATVTLSGLINGTTATTKTVAAGSSIRIWAAGDRWDVYQ